MNVRIVVFVRRLTALSPLLPLVLLIGCSAERGIPLRAATAPSAPAQRPGASADIRDVSLTDPCANRLHDLAGSLLLYHATHYRLPPRLTDLEQITGPLAPAALGCPVSEGPYIYNPDGLLSPDTKSLLVVYDPAPTHAGRRHAISIVAPSNPTDALVIKIISLPNQAFQPAEPSAKGN